MLRHSLTVKIPVVVGVTVGVLIAIYTYFVVQVHGARLRERVYAQNLITITLVREYVNGVMLGGRHVEVQRFIERLKQSGEIRSCRVVRVDGQVVFSTATQDIYKTVLPIPPELFESESVFRSTRIENGETIAVVSAPVRQLAECKSCHPADQEFIGAVVIEKSMLPTEAALARSRNLMIVYGIVIFVLVGTMLWLLLSRLVIHPVRDLLQQMRLVQAGNLSARVNTASTDEMGALAESFNAMVQSLQQVTAALKESHERQIQQADKLASIGELSAGIAHEIRNPLAGIGAAVEVLAENGSGDRRQFAEVAGEIRTQIRRLNTTLRELLDFARQREPEITACAVADLLKPMLSLVRIEAQKQEVAVIEQCAPDLPPVCADAQQVQQALLNVLLNAVQAMPGGGTLTVRVEVAEKTLVPGHDRTVRIAISDTGCGIPRENLSRIFSPFFSTKSRGTGLGLAITRGIMEKHHGTISVASEPNRGTTVTLEFAACGPKEELAYAENQSAGH